MNRLGLGLVAFSFVLGCLSPEEREARRAERDQRRAEKHAQKQQKAAADAQEKAQEQAAKDAQAQADQEANAKRAESERTVNLETVCQGVADSYSKHCSAKSAPTYIWCLGNQPPATIASINAGQSQKCSADISKADCAVLAAGVLPASCGTVGPSAQQTTAPAAKDPGGVTVAKACGPLMEQHCNKCDAANMKSCVDQSLSWCYNGREPTAGTGMSADQYSTCSKAYKQLRCDAAGTGYVPMDCPGLR